MKKFNSFGDLLNSLMRARAKNQSWLVQQTGKDKKQISRYVNNRTEPMPDTLQDISVALGVQIEKEGDQYVLIDPHDSRGNLNMSIFHRSILNDAESLVAKIRRIIEIEQSQQAQ